MKLDFLKQRQLFEADLMLRDFLRPDDLCFTLQKEIIPRIKLSDFESMYSEKGRPPVSPVVLIVILILQYIERLTDRAAANNLRFRLDWKIALGLELDYQGIHPTTLVHFRDRLLVNEQASYAFDRVLDHLKECGLVKKGSKQRIDSTHVIGEVRELSRIELFHETLRLFMIMAKSYRPQMSVTLQEKYEFYLSHISTRGISSPQRAKFISEAGLAMGSFIVWVNSSANYELIKKMEPFKALNTVFFQNFVDDVSVETSIPELIPIATGKDHVCSPHDVDARYGSKGGKGWLGYKAQVAESVPLGDDLPNFITYIDVNDATAHDSNAISSFIRTQIDCDLKPSDIYADTHYNSLRNIEKLSGEQIDLKGPVVAEPKTPIKQENQGFTYDSEAQSITCSMGILAERIRVHKPDKIHGRFSAQACLNCTRRGICNPQKRGKQITLRQVNEVLKKRREDMHTEIFKQDMNKRNGIEGAISGLVRGQKMRRTRYRGKSKTRLHIKFCGAAANIMRLHQVRCVRKSKMTA